MLIRAWRKIDKFYLVLIAVLIVLAIPMVITFKGIFSAIISAYELESDAQAGIRIDKQDLEKAESSVFNREIVPLTLKSGNVVIIEEEEEEGL